MNDIADAVRAAMEGKEIPDDTTEAGIRETGAADESGKTEATHSDRDEAGRFKAQEKTGEPSVQEGAATPAATAPVVKPEETVLGQPSILGL